MRQIKFRGKRIDNQQWVYGNLIIGTDGKRVFIIDFANHDTDTYSWHEIIPETVGQYTGLKDKKGNEIYAGDILRGFQKEQSDKEGKYGFVIKEQVHYSLGGFKVFGKCLQDGYTRNDGELWQFMWCYHGWHGNRDSYYQIDDIEIIGNIHDNKELLEQHEG
jgi:uncharacterized phage protein (TIGR01671 family)